MSEWDDVVKEWLVDTEFCHVGGLCSAEDGVVYAAAGTSEDDAWATIYKDDFEIETVEDDGVTPKTVAINEGKTIMEAVTDGKAPHGVFLGGTKHKVVRFEDDFEYNDSKFTVVVCARPKGGAHLIKTQGGTVVIVLFDEDRGHDKSSSQNTGLAFAEYLDSQGY